MYQQPPPESYDEEEEELLCHPMRSSAAGRQLPPGAAATAGAADDADRPNSDDDDVLPEPRGAAGGLRLRDDTAAEDDDDAQFARDLRDRRIEAELQAVRRQQSADVHLRASPAPSALESVSGGAGSSNRRQVVPLSTAASSLGSARRTSGAASGRSTVTDAARLIALEDECKSLQKIIHTQEKNVARLATESEKQTKVITTLSQKVDKEVAAHREYEQKLRLAEVTIAAQKKEIVLLTRGVATGGATGSAADASGNGEAARLQRANEEIARLRAELSAAGSDGSGGGDQLVTLRAENKRLDAQRVELLSCIRKQNKLIDVLKRQKLHLEAAKLISMTEEEFTKILEINQK